MLVHFLLHSLVLLSQTRESDRLVSAVVAALCSPTVWLRSTFPDSCRQLSPSDNSGLPMTLATDTHHYPILVEQMSSRVQVSIT